MNKLQKNMTSPIVNKLQNFGANLNLNESRSDWDEESLISRAPSNDATSRSGFASKSAPKGGSMLDRISLALKK